ncbi:L,D-transpeptidase family protein [Sphingomonas sp. ASV193]|uniref:L,D-transpeptidase family protein n=1 Tax=Sphingomonas sp. ASV193 TaxID=3144405 RepID=UPI0032E8D1DE
MTRLMLLTSAALAALPIAAPAQVAPMGQVTPYQPGARPAPRVDPLSPAASQPVTTTPVNTPQSSQPVEPLPPPPPPAIWPAADVAALISYIQGIGKEGLNPADYDPAGLQAALASRDPAIASAAATARFNQLSNDLALGHVRGTSRVDWHVVDKDLDATRQRALLDGALAHHQVPQALDALLPTHPQYGALRAALAETIANDPANTARINLIRLNMDRWRWLPRDLGRKYVIVNIPSFHVTLVQDGQIRWKQRAIAGKVTTKTPNLSVLATGVVLNPSWAVPDSISGEVRGKKGFTPVKAADGHVKYWLQPPGPTNALGELKFVMPNKYNIYLHDTNARSRFNSDVRALSHGCVRTQNIVDLATTLLMDDGGKWTPESVRAALDTKKTQVASFVKPVPVYIVYFSAAAATDGTITTYQDLYNRDPAVISALLTRTGESAKAKAADQATKNKGDDKTPESKD